MTSTGVGYSATPLARKLGIREGMTVARVDPPEDLDAMLAPLPGDVISRDGLRGRPDIVLLFVTRRSAFRRRLAPAGRAIFPAGAIWVCWPKRSSGVSTDMTEDAVRELALPSGLVDNKVCAVDDTWSGLRIVWRREHRDGNTPPTG